MVYRGVLTRPLGSDTLPNVLLLLFEDNASHTRGTQQPVADVAGSHAAVMVRYHSCLDKYAWVLISVGNDDGLMDDDDGLMAETLRVWL